METAEPVENSQVPITSILPFRNPDMEEVDAQVIFTTFSVPVFETEPPTLNAPFIVAVPEAVSKAFVVLVPLMVSDAPEFMVRLLHTPVVPDN
jgi:hypothetical protein